MPGVTGITGVSVIPFGGEGAKWIFDVGDAAFTAAMDKRLCTGGPFYTAPIVQGLLDGTGTPDVVTHPRGTQLGNPFDLFYANQDLEQGSLCFWITPEWNGDDGLQHYIYGGSSRLVIYKYSTNVLILTIGGQQVSVDVSAWTAGTTYFVCARWNTHSTLDGTNYACLTINAVDTFGATTAPTPDSVGTLIRVGLAYNTTLAADSIIQGLTVYRRVLYDGTYGTDVGNGDELAAIYAAGAGADPCTITGSWDVVFCLPTNSTDEELTTGTGEAWSHPHGSNEIDVWGNWDGGLPGTPYAVEFNGTNTKINCGSGATLDDLPDAAFTAIVWFRWNSSGSAQQLLWKRQDGDGWYLQLQSDGDIGAVVVCATTNAITTSSGKDYADGKWHCAVMTFDDAGTRDIALWVDGVDVSDIVTTGVGAYQSDAANSLVIGGRETDIEVLDGAIAWVALYDALEYTAGTNFIPPRTAPTPGGNLVECWHLDEGTGATAAAQVTSPANDGTITSGSWSSIWEVESTPVVPQSLEFDGSATRVDCGSAADIDFLASAAFTVEAVIRVTPGDTNAYFMNKGTSTTGWALYYNTSGHLAFAVRGGTTSIVYLIDDYWIDGCKHHVCGSYDPGGDGKAHLWLDGIYIGAGGVVVAPGDDSASTLFLGAYSGAPLGVMEGSISIARISDSVRYTHGQNFVPYGFTNPPAVDGNTLRQFNFTDGAGTTLTDATGTANGTITLGSGQWNNTPDMSIDEPGARVFSQGYNIGSDGADDGITIIQAAVTASTDYVLRLVQSYGQSGLAWPNVYLYDNSNAAQIGATYNLPRVSDVHTGGNNSATLINANGAFTQQLVGWTAYNITDGSSTTITAVSGDKTTITGVLAGGTDNDWDTNDVYILRPPSSRPYAYHPNATESIFVFRTPAGCTSIDVKIRNANGAGVMQIHQCEVLESLLDNGDHESLNGGFPGAAELITGWTNSNLDAGDTEPEATIIHAGAQSLEWNTGASAEGMFFGGAIATVGKFYAFGLWVYGDGTIGFNLGCTASNRGVVQYAAATALEATGNGAYWEHNPAVFRAINANLWPFIQAVAAATGDRFTDDVYAFELDDVSLTVTPASLANSTDGNGRVAVNGRDTLIVNPLPTGYLFARNGDVQWSAEYRHPAALLGDFGTLGGTAYYGVFWFDATHYFAVYASAGNNIRLEFNTGGGAQQANWNCAGLIASGDIITFQVQYVGTWMRLLVDGVEQARITAAVDFGASIPNIFYAVTSQPGVRQGDVACG